MPLSSAPGVQNFVQNREPATTHANLVTRSITPQPQQQHRERSRQNDTQGGHHARSNSHNGASSKKELFRHDPESLKLQVPNTLRKTVSAIPQTHAINTGRGSGSNAAPKTRAPRQVGEPEVSAFDDTQSIHFDDSTSILDDANLTVQFGHDDHHQFPLDPPKTATREVYRRAHQEDSTRPHAGGHNIFLPANWKAQVEKEKRLQERHFGASLDTYHDHSQYDDRIYGDTEGEGYDEDGVYAGKKPHTWEDTPSRPRPGTEARLSPRPKLDTTKQQVRPSVADEPDSPPLPSRKGDLPQQLTTEPAQPQVVNRFKIRQSLDSPAQADQPKASNTTAMTATTIVEPQSRHNPPFSSKVSSYHDSSSEEDQPAGGEPSTKPPSINSSTINLPSGTKRPHSFLELDYDLEALKTKTFADLDSIPFNQDPALPSPQAVLDSNGNPMSLAAKLTNLSKMRPEDQTQLFRTHTDTEREETATWFLDKFRDDMRMLMRARVERRKVALRFEMLVKMRDRKLALKKADVQAELDALKKGGGELIAGRVRSC
ncbi:uncharacterized protein A1O9_04602 [Exophiala aquamarina CBS 119918]|uniref:Extracellular mutant protein 11 C-terminal domain-containing protein n=1 Tax=Exophiala aquamarina CBS 119918 TaxID=1182545 RepID=A0A072PI34_9EURO|nr:uncharacterized protein A1O9_04602 [Exophiala aquamarina CBS 119918]KEF59754.1 hypothetical protein A1O9_04602 [Exophiala aquamarina CBS 119918]